MVKSGLSTNAASKLLPSRLLKPLTRGVRPLVCQLDDLSVGQYLTSLVTEQGEAATTSAAFGNLVEEQERLSCTWDRCIAPPKERH